VSILAAVEIVAIARRFWYASAVAEALCLAIIPRPLARGRGGFQMVGNSWRCRLVVAAMCGVATCVDAIRAEEPLNSSKSAEVSASPADSNLQREYVRLAQLLN
jgi:hypothetical protein